MSDEQFILKNLFETNQKKIIFCKDYFDELLGVRFYLLSEINRINIKETYNKYYRELSDLVIKNRDPKGYDKKSLVSNYSFLLSVSDKNYKGNFPIYKELLANSPLFETQIDDPSITEVLIENSIDNETVKRIFSEFKYKSLSKVNDICSLLKSYLLTRNLLKDKKRIFFFISSNTADISLLKDKIRKGTCDQAFELNNPSLPDKNYSLIRSKAQLFASLIYKWAYGNDIGDSINNLSDFIKKIRNLSQLPNDKLLNLLKETNNEDRETIENITIYQERKKVLSNRLENIKERSLKVSAFNELINNYKTNSEITSEKRKELESLLKELPKYIENVENELTLQSNPENLKTLINPAIFDTDIVVSFLIHITNSKDHIYLNRGKDSIESFYNSFPHIKKYNIQQELIAEVFQNSNGNAVDSNQIKILIAKFIDENSNTETISVFIIYLLLLIDFRDYDRTIDLDFYSSKYLWKLIEKRKFRNSLRKKKDNNDSKLADLYTLYCWSLRRAARYKYAFIATHEAESIFPNDYRFKHSFALIGFTWKYEFDSKEQYEIDYREGYYPESGKNSVLDYGEKALEYLTKEESPEDKICNNYRLSILNFVAYLYAVNYSFSKTTKSIVDLDLLQHARILINRLKNEFDIKTRKEKFKTWRSFPSYLHTECFIEYHELLNLVEIPQIDEKFHTKLKYAMDDISHAIILLENSRKGLIPIFNKLKTRLLNLSVSVINIDTV